MGPRLLPKIETLNRSHGSDRIGECPKKVGEGTVILWTHEVGREGTAWGASGL